MKPCTRFHFDDLERGDRVHLSGGRRQEFKDFVDEDRTIVVAQTYRTNNFGEMIDAVGGATYYLQDWDNVRYVPDNVRYVP